MKKGVFVIKYRWWIIITTVLLVVASIIPLLQIRINPDLESYMPDSMPSKQNNRIISDVFGNDEMILIVLETRDVLDNKTLTRVRQISEDFSQMPGFGRVYSICQAKNIRSEDGSMVVDPALGQLPQNDSEREALRTAIRANDMAYQVVVSDDFRYALIMLSSNKTIPDDQLMEIVNATLAKFPGKEKVYVTGAPYLRDESNQKIGHDLLVLLPIGLLVMFLFLFVTFREIKSVLLPFSAVLFSIVICLALIPVFGWELSLIGVLIPIMMIAIANNYGVYFIARYQDLNAAEPDLSVNALVKKTTNYLIKPVVLCGLTTIVGVLGLVAHLLIPARQMGVVTALGIAFALLVSLLFIPAVMSLLKKGNARKALLNGTNGFFTAMVMRAAHWVTKKPGLVIIVFILFLGLSSAGLFFLKIAPDSNKVLPEKHAFNKAINITDSHFGGSKVIYAMFDGDVTDPVLLHSLDRYEQELKMLPNVGTVTSLATIVKKISKALNDSTESGYNAIPTSRQAIAQYLELYSMSGDPADLEQYVSFDYTQTLMTIQYQADNLAQVRQIPDMLHRLSQKDSLTPVIGGPSLTDKDISESVEHGQYYSLLAAFVAILILLSLIFKSIHAGMLGSLPLVFAVLCTFGLMGWLGIELNIVTALLSSISIGLGVDFTIHVLWRIKWELASGNDYAGSITSTLRTIGRGIIINACSVMLGFAVLFLSAFPLIRSFAFLIIVSLFLCLVSGLVLVPAFCYLFRPEFLNKPIKNTYE